MKWISVLAIAGAAFCACLPATSAAPGRADQVVALLEPGLGVGEVRIGGRLPQRDTYYQRLGLKVDLENGNGTPVAAIWTKSKRFATKEGIRVGSSFKQVRQAFASGKEDTESFNPGCEHLWLGPGINFLINRNKVAEIRIAAIQN
jgi:hypothetical protein